MPLVDRRTGALERGDERECPTGSQVRQFDDFPSLAASSHVGGMAWRAVAFKTFTVSNR